MKSSAPLSRGSGGLTRSTPLARSSGLAKRSAKREKAYAGGDGVEGRRAFVARILRERPLCEAGARITWAPSCGGTAASEDVHELLRRSAGGSIVDDANVIACCRRDHQTIHLNPREARAAGLLLSRFAPTTALESP